MQKIATVKAVQRELREKVPRVEGGNGFTTRHAGFQYADIEIWVDAVALARNLGLKAMDSKRRVSKLQGGEIVVKAVNVREAP